MKTNSFPVTWIESGTTTYLTHDTGSSEMASSMR
jgi:hypothetical protein